MSSQTVLLTGATGFVGFRVLEQLLEQGRHVRLAIRSESKLFTLKDALAKQQYDTSKIEHVVVPDMLAPGAFAEAIKGVTDVIHLASPLPSPSDDLEASIVKPAVSMTTGILETLLKSSERSVKKIVITSSIIAVFPAEPGRFDADTVVPDPSGPFTNEWAAYAASKQLSLNATRRIIQERKPYFDVVTVMPSFVIGPNHLLDTRKEYVTGSNAIALAPLLGSVVPGGRPAAACHVDDVAAVHVAALQPSVVGHHNYGVTFNGERKKIEWDSAIDIVKQKMPEAVGPEGFPLGGSVASTSQDKYFDVSKTEKELGLNFKDFETMVVDLASAYIAAKA